MFNVGIGEIAVIVLVCLVVFGPQRLPAMARQAGRWLAQARLAVERSLDELKQQADLKDLDLPDLRVGSLRQQARDYVRELLDVEGQMAELERERDRLRAALDAAHDQAQVPDGVLEQVPDRRRSTARRPDWAWWPAPGQRPPCHGDHDLPGARPHPVVRDPWPWWPAGASPGWCGRRRAGPAGEWWLPRSPAPTRRWPVGCDHPVRGWPGRAARSSRPRSAWLRWSR